MKEFHSPELTRKLQKVIDLVLNSAQEGEPIKVEKGFIDDLFTGGFDTIEVSNLFFVYSNEQKRNEDFETLKHYISLPESKEIETQQVEVMVKITFEAKATLSKSEIEEEAKARINELKSPSIQLLDFIECDIIEIKEEAEIYGNEKPTKAILKAGETEGCTAESKNGVYNLTVKHGEKYDFMYDDEGNFYLIVDDRVFPETSTAFNFE